VPSTETPHLDLLFAGSVFCDLVFAGVPVPEPGAEVFADAFKLTPGGVANRAVAGSRLGARTALLSQLGDDPLGLHMVAVLSAEPDLDLTWLRCTPGFQSPVTVSLTGMHERLGALGGDIRIDNAATGGVRLAVRLPLEQVAR